MRQGTGGRTGTFALSQVSNILVSGEVVPGQIGDAGEFSKSFGAIKVLYKTYEVAQEQGVLATHSIASDLGKEKDFPLTKST